MIVVLCQKGGPCPSPDRTGHQKTNQDVCHSGFEEEELKLRVFFAVGLVDGW